VPCVAITLILNIMVVPCRAESAVVRAGTYTSGRDASAAAV